jgi:hypothetical protein
MKKMLVLACIGGIVLVATPHGHKRAEFYIPEMPLRRALFLAAEQADALLMWEQKQQPPDIPVRIESGTYEIAHVFNRLLRGTCNFAITDGRDVWAIRRKPGCSSAKIDAPTERKTPDQIVSDALWEIHWLSNRSRGNPTDFKLKAASTVAANALAETESKSK